MTPDVDSMWIRQLRPTAEGHARLVCLPHAGGSASFFRPLAQALPPWVDVWGVQYPGRQDRRHERCLTRIADLADAAFHAVRGLADYPIAFFGHSMGAVIAFEVAQRWEQLTPEAFILIVSGRPAPSLVCGEGLHLRSDTELLAELGNLSGTDRELLADKEVQQMILPALRADYAAIETYRCQSGRLLSCPISIFTGHDDPKVNAEQAAAWQHHTRGPSTIRTLPGGHFYLTQQWTTLAQLIAQDLSAMPEPHSGTHSAATASS